jgi:hypothetical protein
LVQTFPKKWWVESERDDDEVRFVLGQRAELDFYRASSLKQQSEVDMLLRSDLFVSTPVRLMGLSFYVSIHLLHDLFCVVFL